jgi:hypothetical protein
VFRRLVTASAIVGAGLMVAGCAVQPLKLGSAAIVGNQRISVATLDGEVTNLSQAAKQYPGVANLTATQQTQATLSWLIRYQINDELARQQGITVSAAQAQTALNQAVAGAKASYEQEGVTNPSQTEVLVLSGIPPNTASALGRWAAIATAAGSNFTKAECQAAKALNIQVNPQFGQLDYSQYAVVTSPSTVTRTQGPVKASSSPSATAPAC